MTTTVRRGVPTVGSGPDLSADAPTPGRATALIGGAFILVVIAHVTARLVDTDHRWLINVPPIVGRWDPHLGWGSPLALLTLAAAVWVQRQIGAWPLRRAVGVGYALALAWTISLALIDGPWGALMERPGEYLSDLPRIASPLTFLATYVDHVAVGTQQWSTHVAAHPPLATLIFWTLDRMGLRGGVWSGWLCIIVGSGAAIAWASVANRLGRPELARRAIVPLALSPAAIWVGVSADGLFAGVAAIGTALAVGGALQRRPLSSIAGGLLLGAVPFLSYGLVLFVIPLTAVVALSVRHAGLPRVRRGWAISAVAAVSVFAAMSAGGFWWWEGLSELHTRYYAGVASVRPQWYFIWANPAALVVCLSPLAALALWSIRAAWGEDWRRGWRQLPAVAAIPAAALFAMAVADVTAMSKAETERIWLPFAMAVPLAYARLPRRWRTIVVIAAAGWALAVNHLARTGW